MATDELFEMMKKLIAENLNIDKRKIKMETSFQQDLGLDSLDTYELVFAAEEQMGIIIPDERANKFRTVRDAYEFIKSHKNNIHNNAKVNNKLPKKTKSSETGTMRNPVVASEFMDIFEAARYGTVEDIRYFIEVKGVSANIKEPDRDNDTPLHTASYHGNIEVVKYLISKEANINAKMDDGYFVLDCAIGGIASNTGNYKNNVAIVEYLISKGVNVDAKAEKRDYDNESRTTALHLSARMGYIKVAKALVSGGADINAKTVIGNTPLDDAIRKNNYEMVEYLKSIGARRGAFSNVIIKILKFVGIGLGILILLAMCGVCYNY